MFASLSLGRRLKSSSKVYEKKNVFAEQASDSVTILIFILINDPFFRNSQPWIVTKRNLSTLILQTPLSNHSVIFPLKYLAQ